MTVYSAYTREMFNIEFLDGCKAVFARDFDRAKARFSQAYHNVNQLFFKRQIDYLNARQKAGTLVDAEGRHINNPVDGVTTYFNGSGTGIHRRVNVAFNANSHLYVEDIRRVSTSLWLREKAPYVAGGVVAGIALCCMPWTAATKGLILLAGTAVGAERAVDRICKGV